MKTINLLELFPELRIVSLVLGLSLIICCNMIFAAADTAVRSDDIIRTRSKMYIDSVPKGAGVYVLPTEKDWKLT